MKTIQFISVFTSNVPISRTLLYVTLTFISIAPFVSHSSAYYLIDEQEITSKSSSEEELESEEKIDSELRSIK